MFFFLRCLNANIINAYCVTMYTARSVIDWILQSFQVICREPLYYGKLCYLNGRSACSKNPNSTYIDFVNIRNKRVCTQNDKRNFRRYSIFHAILHITGKKSLPKPTKFIILSRCDCHHGQQICEMKKKTKNNNDAVQFVVVSY